MWIIEKKQTIKSLKMEPNFTRVIVDSSYPPGLGINDAIPKNFYRGKYMKVSLPTTNDIVNGIRRVKARYPGHPQ